ncbi:aldehyde dehydrogenase [Streptosporangium sp. 'caverna']|uniref:aldehyde dehydrogenase family protein n=1 Tax=Streptosporangium sp. 'caverna' TaxID=2202249 RepID=UPI000D7E0EB4|nr:aldehyde dehydrogenase family protein [Streptosporangium sp. 'caverna']AWS43887.1 betaine-aldehyde dehydrogenase [Streptosporangium sp. 'caverna']
MTRPLTLDASARPAPAFLDGPAKKLLIDGVWTAARSGETFETVDPATGKVLTSVASAGAEDVDLAVAAARRAFEASSWADITPYQRSKVLLQIADVLEAHAGELAVLDSLDMGGPLWMTRWLVDHSVEVFRHYAGWPTKIYGQTAPSDPSAFHYTLRQPLGVVGAITAWNGPVLQLAWKLGPALATGNTVVAKPAAWSPLSALRIGELLLETDLPHGVVNIVTGDGALTGEALTNHPDVDKISFTGSLAVGKRILEVSSKDLKRVTLELGGKSPTIVFDDADLEAAAKGAVAGFAQGSGEGCVAGTRIFVQESVRERFRELLLREMKAYTMGDPFHPDTRMGPLASAQHFQRVASYLDVAHAEGGTLEIAGESEGLYMPPVLIENVGADARVVREEIFGPVASLMTFTDTDDAIAQGNDTIYGLSASVWTTNLERAHRTASGLRAGTVWVNAYADMSAGTVPFGGFKQSGLGREHGIEVLDAYTETKTVMVHL